MFVRRAKAITIDERKCEGCKKCVRLCFQDVFRFDEVREVSTVCYLDECEACMVCEASCPAGAINVTPQIPVHMADPFR